MRRLHRLTVFRWRDLAVPLVDGQPLYVLVGGDVAPGRFPGAPAELAPRWWRGEVDPADGASVLLDGSCGVAGCCGVLADVAIDDTTVTWSHLWGRGRPPVTPGLLFTFRRSSYEARLDEIAALVPVDELPGGGATSRDRRA